MEINEGEMLQLSQWALNEILAQASASVRGIQLESVVDEEDRSSRDNILTISSEELSLLVESAAGVQNATEVIKNSEVVEKREEHSEGRIKDRGEEDKTSTQHDPGKTPNYYNKKRAAKMTFSCSLIDGGSFDSENIDYMLGQGKSQFVDHSWILEQTHP